MDTFDTYPPQARDLFRSACESNFTPISQFSELAHALDEQYITFKTQNVDDVTELPDLGSGHLADALVFFLFLFFSFIFY